MEHKIVFGTDGWRGIIARDFTFENVYTVAQAIADYLNQSEGNKTTVIGHDTRFMGNDFAKAVAEVFAANNISVLLGGSIMSTPAVSRIIKNRNLCGGIMITASHNPSNYSGVKFKADYAGSADETITQEMEKFLYVNEVKRMDFDKALEAGLIKIENLQDEYLQGVKDYIDIDALQKAKHLNFVVDSMYGAGATAIEDIMKETECEITTIRKEPNPSFPGIAPEPIALNLEALMEAVKNNKAVAGIATDGDADRVGAVDENGNFITPHQIVALLLIHLIENKKLTGKIVKTISSSYLISKIAEEYNLETIETPIGFKHICKLMREDDILIGGEESGGIGFKNYIPERDGILSGLLLIELLAEKGKTLGEMIQFLDDKFGKLRYSRIDRHFPNEKKVKALKSFMDNPPTEVLGKKVKEVKTYDGIKLIFEDNTWLLYRASGTEPLLRIYTESHSDEEVQTMLEHGLALAEERGA